MILAVQKMTYAVGATIIEQASALIFGHRVQGAGRHLYYILRAITVDHIPVNIR